ncbi:MAG: hypothetical protein ABII22_03935 [Candidatus Micrarchaeota archaeon]
MKKTIIFLATLVFLFMNGCLQSCSEEQKVFESKLTEFRQFTNSDETNFTARYVYCDEMLIYLESHENCFRDYSKLKSELTEACNYFKSCIPVDEKENALNKQIKDIGDIVKNGENVNFSTVLSYCDATLSMIDQYKDCFYDYEEVRPILGERCSNVKFCAEFENDFLSAFERVVKTHTTHETNTVLMKDSCDDMLKTIDKGKTCVNDTILQTKIIDSTRIFCGYEDKANICVGFPNNDFEGKLSEWYPYIEVNGNGNVVEENYPDFSLERDSKNNLYLKIQNTHNSNERSSISHRLVLEQDKMGNYNFSFKILNSHDLTNKSAIIYARISFLDKELGTLAEYYWVYADENTVPEFFGVPYTNNFGPGKDADWRLVSIHLQDAANEVVPLDKIDQINGIRFSSGIYNFEDYEVSMYLDDILIECN